MSVGFRGSGSSTAELRQDAQKAGLPPTAWRIRDYLRRRIVKEQSR
jgi:hypothetical protein